MPKLCALYKPSIIYYIRTHTHAHSRTRNYLMIYGPWKPISTRGTQESWSFGGTSGYIVPGPRGQQQHTENGRHLHACPCFIRASEVFSLNRRLRQNFFMDFNELFCVLLRYIIGRAMTLFYHPRRPLNMTIYQKKKKCI